MKQLNLQRVNTLVCILLTSAIGFGQQWVQEMLKPNANFFEIQAAFNQEWEGLSYEKGKGWKQYKRWEAFWEKRVMDDGTFPMQHEAIWNEFKDLITAPKLRSGGAGNWSPMGPSQYNNTDSWSPGIGRINCVAEDPNNSQIIYAGTPAGGVWKTTNGGSTWTPLSDELSVIGISGIAVDHSNTDIIYISTGDRDGGDTYSIGVMKSTDGGASWTSTGNLPNATTGEILMHPSNNQELVIACDNGIYKTTNGGNTWQNRQAGSFRDIAYKPGAPNTMYAASASNLYISTDGGDNWSNSSSGLPNSSGRLCIATTEANSNYVYILSATTGYGFQGVYRSTNSGASFSAMNTSTDIFESTQAWYDMAFAASPTNANELVSGVLDVWKSTNGGTSWTKINSWSNPGQASYTHADIHYLGYFNNRLFCGSDGGIYKSTNSGGSFTDLTPGMQIGQFYRIGGTQNDPNKLAGGLQDNGGYAWDGSQWKVYYGADGMEAGIDRNNSNLVFGMIQNGSLYRSNNGGNSSQGQGSPQSGRWVTPMAMDPNNDRLLAGYDDLHEYDYNNGWNQLSSYNFPDQLHNIEIYDGNSNIIYVTTGDNVFKTTNGGGAFTDVTGNLPTNSSITSIEINPQNSDELWLTRGGWNGSNHVYHTTNGGGSWSNITNNLPNLPCNIVKYDAGTNGEIYVGTDVGVYFYQPSTSTWIQYSNNLPNVIVNDLEINEGANIIRAGTYGRGVWESSSISATEYDASISAIISPNGTVCDGNGVTPVITLTNYGALALTSVTINYNINGSNGQTYNWTGNLLSGGSEDITLPSMNPGMGSHTFNTATSSPNGQTDEDSSNDEASQGFTIQQGNPLVLEITTDCWGSETTWNIRDDQGTVVTSGGPYNDVTGGETMNIDLCLPDGCYDFKIYDTYGDGMFGSQWNSCTVDGNYQITGNGITYVAMADPDFGDSIEHNFCVPQVSIEAHFNSTTTTICAGETVDFTDSSYNGTATSWTWSFPGAANNSSSDQNPTGIQYLNAGTYDVELTVSNGTSTNTTTLQSYITVIASPNITITSTDTDCTTDNGTATASATGSGLSYQWSHGPTTPSISGLGTGLYTVTVTNSTGCSTDESVTISSLNGPTLSITPDQDICEGDNVDLTVSGLASGSYNWDNGLGSNATVSVSPTQTTTYTVTATDAAGCTAIASSVVTVTAVPSLNVSPLYTEICEGETVTILASGANQYSWNNGSSSASISVSPASTTTYEVVGSNGNCDSDPITAEVNVTPAPTAVANSSVNITTVGTSITFTTNGSNGNGYWWDFGNGTTSSLDSLDYAYGAMGTYTVVLSAVNGNCIDTDTLFIEIGSTDILEQLDGSIVIFPNPSEGEVYLQLSQPIGPFDLEITNALGQRIQFIPNLTTSQELNLNHLESAIYYLRIHTDQGIINRRLVIR